MQKLLDVTLHCNTLLESFCLFHCNKEMGENSEFVVLVYYRFHHIGRSSLWHHIIEGLLRNRKKHLFSFCKFFDCKWNINLMMIDFIFTSISKLSIHIKTLTCTLGQYFNSTANWCLQYSSIEFEIEGKNFLSCQLSL